jgi:hypothetical protein
MYGIGQESTALRKIRIIAWVRRTRRSSGESARHERQMRSESSRSTVRMDGTVMRRSQRMQRTSIDSLQFLGREASDGTMAHPGFSYRRVAKLS